MANHKSAAKRAKQTIVKTKNNRVKKSITRNIIKKVRVAIEAKDKETATALLPQAQGELKKLANKGIIKNNTAARTTSRLASQVKAL